MKLKDDIFIGNLMLLHLLGMKKISMGSILENIGGELHENIE